MAELCHGHDLRQKPETATVLCVWRYYYKARLAPECHTVEFMVTCNVTVHLMPQAKARPAW